MTDPHILNILINLEFLGAAHTVGARSHCMGSLAVDIVFVEFVTLNRPRLLDRALYLRPNVLAYVAAVREPAGVPRAGLCCALVDVMTEITLQPVRRRHMILFVTQNKRPHGTVGRRNLPTRGIHAARRGKMLLGSDAAWQQGAQHLKGRKIYSLSVVPFLLCLIKTAFY